MLNPKLPNELFCSHTTPSFPLSIFSQFMFSAGNFVQTHKGLFEKQKTLTFEFSQINCFEKLNIIIEDNINDSHELSNFQQKKDDYFLLLRNIEKKYATQLSQN